MPVFTPLASGSLGGVENVTNLYHSPLKTTFIQPIKKINPKVTKISRGLKIIETLWA